MVYVVLPPELSKRSIQILIQYMYSGEATVSNDILNEVLHGGELLKIRGLWRNKTPTASSSESHPFNTPVESTASSGRDSSAYAGDKIIYETVNHERSTNNLSIVKESPVIVTSPTHISAPPAHKSNAPLAHHIAQGIDMPSQTTTSMPLTVQPQPDRPPPPSVQQQTAPSTHHLHRHHVSPHHSKQIVCNDLSTNLFSVSASSHLASIQASILSPPPAHEIAAQHPSNLIVKKELSANANDDRDLSATHYGLVPLQMTTNKMTSSDKRLTKTITENGNSLATNSNVLIRSPANLSISAAAAQYQQRIGRRYSEENFLYAKEPNDEPTRNANHHSLEHSACTDSEHSREKSRNHQLKASRHSMETTSVVENATHSESSASDAIRMMTIKQEPAEWAEFGDGDNHSEKANIEVNVKPELVYPKGDSDEEGKCEFAASVFRNGLFTISFSGEAQDPIYSPLTCELCSETFTIPADWVRHIESHSEPATHCVPKKRKRIEVEEMSAHQFRLRFSQFFFFFLLLISRHDNRTRWSRAQQRYDVICAQCIL